MRPDKPQSDWSLAAMLVVMMISSLWFVTSVIGYV